VDLDNIVPRVTPGYRIVFTFRYPYADPTYAQPVEMSDHFDTSKESGMLPYKRPLGFGETLKRRIEPSSAALQAKDSL
jgi:hypothetical protein